MVSALRRPLPDVCQLLPLHKKLVSYTAARHFLTSTHFHSLQKPNCSPQLNTAAMAGMSLPISLSFFRSISTQRHPAERWPLRTCNLQSPAFRQADVLLLTFNHWYLILLFVRALFGSSIVKLCPSIPHAGLKTYLPSAHPKSSYPFSSRLSSQDRQALDFRPFLNCNQDQ